MYVMYENMYVHFPMSWTQRLMWSHLCSQHYWHPRW